MVTKLLYLSFLLYIESRIQKKKKTSLEVKANINFEHLDQIILPSQALIVSFFNNLIVPQYCLLGSNQYEFNLFSSDYKCKYD